MHNLQIVLTDAICASAVAGSREYALGDTRKRSLSLRVRPSGSKTWVVRHRVSGKPARVAVGSYPGMGVREARQAAMAALAGKVVRAHLAPLFTAFCAEHEDTHGATYKPAGLATYRSYVRTQLVPVFGSKLTWTKPNVLSWVDSCRQRTRSWDVPAFQARGINAGFRLSWS